MGKLYRSDKCLSTIYNKQSITMKTRKSTITIIILSIIACALLAATIFVKPAAEKPDPVITVMCGDDLKVIFKQNENLYEKTLPFNGTERYCYIYEYSCSVGTKKPEYKKGYEEFNINIEYLDESVPEWDKDNRYKKVDFLRECGKYYITIATAQATNYCNYRAVKLNITII